MPQDHGSDETGFLSRWSRRKRAVESEASNPATPVVAETSPQAAAPGEGADGQIVNNDQDSTEKTLTDDVADLIEPPSLDLIDKDFDLSFWLKQNVPESWKLAAMRRTWETDPFIVNYLDAARDYALDWNTPGGAPGYGPMSESDRLVTAATRFFSDLTKVDEKETVIVAEAEGNDIRRLDKAAAGNEADAALHHSGVDPAQSSPVPVGLPGIPKLQTVRLSQKPAETPASPDVAVQDKLQTPAADAPVQHRPRRRSGGAMPI